MDVMPDMTRFSARLQAGLSAAQPKPAKIPVQADPGSLRTLTRSLNQAVSASSKQAAQGYTARLTQSFAALPARAAAPLERLSATFTAKGQSAGNAFTARVSTALGSLSGKAAGAVSGITGVFAAGASKAANALVTPVVAGFSSVRAKAAVTGDAIKTALSQSAAGTKLEGVLDGIGGKLGGIARKAGALAGAGGIWAGLTMGLDRARQIQDVTVAFETMLGSASKAKDMMSQLLAFARQTPFSFPDIADGARKLKAMGIETERVIPLMRTLGDTAAASGKGAQGLQVLVDIIGKLKAGSRLYTEDVNRLSDFGINAWEMLAKGTGKSMDQIRKDVTAGAVDADKAIAILTKGMDKQFGGAMSRLKGTITGTFDTFKSAISEFFADAVILPAWPAIQQLMVTIADTFKRLAPLIKGLMTGAFTAVTLAAAPFAAVLKLILAGLKPLAPVLEAAGTVLGVMAGSAGAVAGGLFLATKAFSLATTAVKVFRAGMIILNVVMMANPFVLITVAILAAVAAVVLAYKRFAGFRAVVDATGRVLRAGLVTAFGAVRTAVAAVTGFVSRNWPLLLGILTGPFGLFAWFIIRFRAQITAAFAALWAAVRAVTTGALSALAAWFTGWCQATVNTSRAIWSALAGFFAGLFAQVRAIVTGTGAAIAAWFTGWCQGTVNTGRAIWSALAGFFAGLFGQIRGIFTSSLSAISGAAAAAWSAIGGTARSAFTSLAGFFTSILGRIQNSFRTAVAAIGKIWSGLGEVCKAPVNFVIDKVYNNGIRKVWNAVGKIVGLGNLEPAATLAAGGVVPGYRPGRDSVHALLSPGEGVLRPEAVRWLGAGWLTTVNRAARRGSLGPAAPAGSGRNPAGFFLGGIVNKVSGLFSGALKVPGKIGDWMRDGVAKVADMALSPIKGWITGNMKDPLWVKAIGGMGVKLLDGVTDMIRSREDAMGGSGSGIEAFNIAKRFLGVPYVWGGTSPSGFDCSGLTQYAWKHAGVGIPRVSEQQQTFGELIGKGSEGTGDLLFFGGSMTGGGAGHVGMASDRKGVMIHAPNTGAVIRMDNFAWPNYTGARRPGGGGGGGGAVGAPGGGAQQWAGLVRQVLSMLSQPASALNAVLTRIRTESGGNPRAINNWDSNAKAGTPSKGLMQCIDPTFNAYAGPLRGKGIWDPLANIYAGCNYARHRYGGRWIWKMSQPGGYDTGGFLPPGLSLVRNSTGHPEPVLTGAQWDALSKANGPVSVRVFIGDQELTGIVRTEVGREQAALARVLGAA
jgi:tape measure domain-containing protein